MNKLLKTLVGLALALAVVTVGQARAATLTLDPVNGALSGAAGSTVGWGFTLTNDTTGYMEVSSTEFQPATGLGAYADFLGPQLLELAPGASLTQAFDLANQKGVGSFHINSSAHNGDLASGRILLTYDVYSMSLTDGNWTPDSLVSSGNGLIASASVRAVPLPGALWLLGSGFTGLLGLRRRLKG